MIATITALAGAAVGSAAGLAAPADHIQLPQVDLLAVLPMLVVLGGACLGVLVEALAAKGARYPIQVLLTFAVLGCAGFFTIIGAMDGQYASTFGGSVAVDSATYVIWGIILVLAVMSVLLMADRVTEPGGVFTATAAHRIGSTKDRVQTQVAAPMQTEVFPLTLFAVGGMLVFGAATDLVTLFVALEVMSLPLYLLCGLARRRRLISQEAAVKYFLLGAFTSAIMLYGIALLYGYAGSIRFTAIMSAARSGTSTDTLLIAGIALVVVGLLFKASVGPFHLWTPDVYQGAPTPVTAFMAACTKVAAFAALLRILFTALQPMVWTWRPVLMGIAVISMAIGAVLGLTQRDVKRMLAYSSIAHAGFLLMGVMTLTSKGASGTMFYLLSYGFATIGGFAVLTLLRRDGAEANLVREFTGLGRRSPLLAAVMTLFLMSFAGIPLTSGFIGKLSVFTAAMDAGMGWLVVVALLASVVAAYYYLRIVVLMYFTDPDAPEERAEIVVPGTMTAIVIGVCAVVTLLLGLLPSAALDLVSVVTPLLS